MVLPWTQRDRLCGPGGRKAHTATARAPFSVTASTRQHINRSTAPLKTVNGTWQSHTHTHTYCREITTVKREEAAYSTHGSILYKNLAMQHREPVNYFRHVTCLNFKLDPCLFAGSRWVVKLYSRSKVANEKTLDFLTTCAPESLTVLSSFLQPCYRWNSWDNILISCTNLVSLKWGKSQLIFFKQRLH